MADLTPARTAQRLRLAGGEGRHVVVVHVPLEFLQPESVQALSVSDGTECEDGQRLGLAALEHARAVGAGQNSNLDVDLTDVSHAAAVDPNAIVNDALSNTVLQLLLEQCPEHVS